VPSARQEIRNSPMEEEAKRQKWADVRTVLYTSPWHVEGQGKARNGADPLLHWPEDAAGRWVKSLPPLSFPQGDEDLGKEFHCHRVPVLLLAWDS